jgi:hypothetical protein
MDVHSVNRSKILVTTTTTDTDTDSGYFPTFSRIEEWRLLGCYAARLF